MDEHYKVKDDTEGNVVKTVESSSAVEEDKDEKPQLSDETFDQLCQPCLGENKNIDSNKYCVECQEYLCETCVIYHRKFKTTKTHEVTNKTDVNRSDGKQNTVMEFCFQHDGKHIELFCQSHNQLCCTTCKEVYHADCDNIVSVDEAALGIDESKELEDTVSKLDAAHNAIGPVLKQRKQCIKRITTEKDKALNCLDNLRTKVNKIFDQLKLFDETKINRKADLFTTAIDADIDTINNAVLPLQETSAVLKSSSANAVTKFVKMKRTRQIIGHAKEVFGRFSVNDTNDKTLVYTEYTNMIETLLPFKQFGQLNNATSVKTISAPKKMKTSLYMETCTAIRSICQIDENNSYMFTDSVNSNIKAFFPDNKVALVKEFYKEPGDICTMTTSKYAVTFKESNRVQIFRTDFVKVWPDDWTIGYYKDICVLNIKGTCTGLAYQNSILYAACSDVDTTSQYGQSHVEMYSGEGKNQYLRTITYAANGTPLLHNPYRLAPCTDTDHIYVTDHDLGLLKLNTNVVIGPSVTVLSREDKGGLTADEKGHVFVLDYAGNAIKLFGPNEEARGTVLTEMDGIVKPTAVMFSRRNKQLLVAQEDSIEVLVFNIVYDIPQTTRDNTDDVRKTPRKHKAGKKKY